MLDARTFETRTHYLFGRQPCQMTQFKTADIFRIKSSLDPKYQYK
jgi:hypothetical protein